MMKNKWVFISGASSGIGEACAQVFAGTGSNLVLIARNSEKLNSLAEKLKFEHSIEVLAVKADVRNRAEVDCVVNQLIEKEIKIDVLINNAGLALGLDKVQEGNWDDWETMIDTNIKGLFYLTKQLLPSMVKNDDASTIINIGSIAGEAAYPNGAVYCATKAAVKLFSDGLRIDTVDSNIRVCHIQPGMVETNFSLVRFNGDKERAEKVYQGIEALSATDVANSVLFCANQPPHVQICEILLTPTHQASASVVFRTS